MFEHRKRLEWVEYDPATGRGELRWEFRNRNFKALTGFDWRTIGRIDNELRENNGRLQEEKPHGPPPRDLSQEYPRLKQWLEEEAVKANKGGYLTAKKLVASFRVSFPLVGPTQPGRELVNQVTEDVMRAALLKCEFQYGDRHVKRLEARQTPRILNDLDNALRFIINNTAHEWSDISGKAVWRFTRPVAMTDESYLDGAEYRGPSWWNENTRERDVLKRSLRIVLLHTIFSGCNYDRNLECKYWASEWKKKRPNHEFWGKCNGEVIEKYYTDVFQSFGPRGADETEQPILFTDNARMHKRIRSELRGAPEDIMDWATESDEVSVDTQQVLEAIAKTSPQKQPTRADLLKALHSAGVSIYEVTSKAKLWNACVLFLPAYYSELNAIELLWAEIKRVYRDCTDTSLPWEERLKVAVESITPAFVESCFNRSIKWARLKYVERIGPLPTAEPPLPTRCLRHPHCVKGYKHIGRCLVRPPAAAAADGAFDDADVKPEPAGLAFAADDAVSAVDPVAAPAVADSELEEEDLPGVDDADDADAPQPFEEFEEVEDEELFEELDMADHFDGDILF